MHFNVFIKIKSGPVLRQTLKLFLRDRLQVKAVHFWQCLNTVPIFKSLDFSVLEKSITISGFCFKYYIIK